MTVKLPITPPIIITKIQAKPREKTKRNHAKRRLRDVLASSTTVLSRVLMAYGRIQRNTEIDQNNFTTSCEKLPPEDVISSGRVRSVLFRKRFGFSAYSRLPHGPGTLPYSAPVATPPTRASEEKKNRRRLYGYIYAKPYPPPPPAQCW